MTFKLLSYNIRFGGRGREQQIASVISELRPDLVVFQEAIHPYVIGRVAEETGMTSWAARARHSIGYASRAPVPHFEWHYPAGARHSFLEIVLADGVTRVFGLHLSARFSKWSERQRAREIRALLHGIKKYREGFHVLVGDFNTLAPGEVLNTRQMPAWIRALVWMSGRDIQRETIQVMLDAGYVDGYRRLHPDVKGYTFPTWSPHVRLDYVFLPAQHAERLKLCEVVTEAQHAAAASDHYPLVAHLEIP
ncbi:MAG TPA: endonuclease/exonuclease/phosphatase family protein [Pyrinomonadaceae bacterium]|nr:endonuclease/exonuclease/phosphatase family protein [Pyrinomonadaceae bacterium]